MYYTVQDDSSIMTPSFLNNKADFRNFLLFNYILKFLRFFELIKKCLLEIQTFVFQVKPPSFYYCKLFST